MSHEMPEINNLLVLPRLRVQNINTISSPLTWGFPSITAFIGFIQALERKLGEHSLFNLNAIGVVCHGFEPQITKRRYETTFNLSKPAIFQPKEVARYEADGTPPSIVEEGRAHLDITLILGVYSPALEQADENSRQLAVQHVANTVAGMRIAGGSVMPSMSDGAMRRQRPYMLPWPLHYQPEEHDKAWRRLRQRWLPGFALIARDDLLTSRLLELQAQQSDATLLDAWLDISRLNHRAYRINTPDEAERVEWRADPRPGWIVPIPVGYTALSPLHEAGTVARARDQSTPFRFVESVYSLGQWISPHRLQSAQDLLWWSDFDADAQLYRCRNACHPDTLPVGLTALAAMITDDPDSPFTYD